MSAHIEGNFVSMEQGYGKKMVPRGSKLFYLRNSDVSFVGPHCTDGRAEYPLNIPGASPCDRSRIVLSVVP